MVERRGPRCGRVACALILIAMILHATPLSAQERSATPGYAPTGWLGGNEPFEIVRSGTETPAFAVVIDKLDISSLFERTAEGKLRYHGRGPALPSGAHTLTVYDVGADGAWTQIGQFPIQILTRSGFVSTKFEPTFDLTGKGQFGEQHAPDENVPQRPEFQDGTTQMGFRTELVRSAFTVRTQAQVTGVTYQNEALRFGEKGDSAPKVDLSGFRVDLQRGSTVLSLGHVDFGAHRHLITGFQSRGVKLTIGEGRAVSVQLAALNGTSIVGWTNALGLTNARHQVRGATLGVEAIPRTPGLLRLEYGHFRGSLLPLSGFNDGGVVTAETSRGNSIRIASAAASGRWTFDSGYTVSRFDDGFDEQVESGLVVTPIETRSSDALYADLSLALLRERRLGATTATVTLNVRHEDIEPLFRSLGASAQADFRTSSADVAFSLGSITGTIGHGRTRDNLASLDSIFTTRTERSALTLGLPLGTLFARGGAQPRWAPILSIQTDALHQFGEGIPASGEFSIESIPDQISENVALGAEWQVGTFRVGGRVGASTQDNRQIGSENQDRATDTAALTLGWAPAPKLSLGGELGLDRNESEEQKKTDSTFRWAANMGWTFYREMALAASFTNIHAWDDLDARDSENIDSSVELSAGFRLSRADRRKGRIFVRWIDQRTDLIDRSFGLRDARRNASLSTGLTVSLF